MARAVIARDGGVCQINGPKCTHIATHCDHIITIDQGGAALDDMNLRAACRSCNLGRVDRKRVIDADEHDIAARLHSLGLHDIATQVEGTTNEPRSSPSRAW